MSPRRVVLMTAAVLLVGALVAGAVVGVLSIVDRQGSAADERRVAAALLAEAEALAVPPALADDAAYLDGTAPAGLDGDALRTSLAEQAVALGLREVDPSDADAGQRAADELAAEVAAELSALGSDGEVLAVGAAVTVSGGPADIATFLDAVVAGPGWVRLAPVSVEFPADSAEQAAQPDGAATAVATVVAVALTRADDTAEGGPED